MDKDSVIEIVESEAERIRSYGVENLFLIGSYARDEQSESSDVDFLVEFKDGRGLFEDYSGLKRFLEDLTGKDVDLVKKKLVRSELKDSILRGVKVEAKV